MDSSESQSQMDDQDARILCLQNLIEKNIEIGKLNHKLLISEITIWIAEQQIENNTIGESITAIEEIIQTANDISKGHEDRRTNSTELVLDTELLRRNFEVVGKAIQHNTNVTDRMVATAIVGALCSLFMPDRNVWSYDRTIWFSKRAKRIGMLFVHWLFSSEDRSSPMIACCPS